MIKEMGLALGGGKTRIGKSSRSILNLLGLQKPCGNKFQPVLYEFMGCPFYSYFFANAGITASMALSGIKHTLILALGACYGMLRSGTAISGMGQFHPSLIFTSILPIIMSGVLTIYGLVVAIFISGNRK